MTCFIKELVPPGRLFWMLQVLNICISIQTQTDVVVLFSVSISASSVFIPCLTERQRLTSKSLIGNIRQRLNSQHTVNANKIMYLCILRITPTQNMYHILGGLWGAEFTATNEHNHSHTNTQLYLLVQISFQPLLHILCKIIQVVSNKSHFRCY